MIHDIERGHEHGEPWELSSQVDHKAQPAAMSEPLCLPPSETGYQHPWSHHWLRNGDLRATRASWFPVLCRPLNYFLLQLWLGRQLTHVSLILCFHCFSGICIKGCVEGQALLSVCVCVLEVRERALVNDYRHGASLTFCGTQLTVPVIIKVPFTRPNTMIP